MIFHYSQYKYYCDPEHVELISKIVNLYNVVLEVAGKNPVWHAHMSNVIVTDGSYSIMMLLDIIVESVPSFKLI